MYAESGQSRSRPLSEQPRWHHRVYRRLQADDLKRPVAATAVNDAEAKKIWAPSSSLLQRRPAALAVTLRTVQYLVESTVGTNSRTCNGRDVRSPHHPAKGIVVFDRRAKMRSFFVRTSRGLRPLDPTGETDRLNLLRTQLIGRAVAGMPGSAKEARPTKSAYAQL